MNYEELLAELSALEKDLKALVKDADRFSKQAVKNTETGNLAELNKNIQQLREASEKLQTVVQGLAETTDGFDTKEYFESGAFTRQMLEACEKTGINVIGEKGVYEMFPFKVRVVGDAEHAEEVWINRKKLPTFRPQYVADTVRENQQKLYKAAFNAESFMNELAEAYDTICLKASARIGSSQALAKVYKSLTPMARARKEYDMQAFAFDLARLYEKGPDAWMTKTGRRFVFGTSRDGKSGIRVLSSSGVESYIATVYSLHTEEEGE